MKNKLFIEQAVMVIFLLCVGSFFFYGGKYFAGFQYASPLDETIMTIIVIIFHLCLLYYIYRFIRWVVKKTKKQDAVDNYLEILRLQNNSFVL